MKGPIMRTFFLRCMASLTPVMLVAVPALAQAKDKTPNSPFGGMTQLIPMLLFLFRIMYFLMIRPEQRKQKERQKLLSNLKKGDKVMTASGMFGIVGNVKDNTVMVKIAENTVVEFSKNAITSVMNSDGSEKTADKGAEKTDKEEKEKK
jgi:preprotein translocase subunit YajC